MSAVVACRDAAGRFDTRLVTRGALGNMPFAILNVPENGKIIEGVGKAACGVRNAWTAGAHTNSSRRS